MDYEWRAQYLRVSSEPSSYRCAGSCLGVRVRVNSGSGSYHCAFLNWSEIGLDIRDLLHSVYPRTCLLSLCHTM